MSIRSSLIERTQRVGQGNAPAASTGTQRLSGYADLPRTEPTHPLRPHLTSRPGSGGSRSVRAGIMARLKAIGGGPGAGGRSWSPTVRAQAQTRWGGALSTSQRVIVKAHVARHGGGARAGGAKAASKVLSAHISYLARSGTGREGEAEVFYGPGHEDISGRDHVREWAEDRHHFRFIVSAEHGDKIDDLKAYIRETMKRVADDLKEPDLNWIAVNHYDTDQPHSHVLIRGKRANGRNLVIPRAVMGYGFRARAQEHAQELLGELTREQAEVRLRGQIIADRETELDRHLSRHMDEAGNLGPSAGLDRQGTYAAMMRGRIAHLEKLGLASKAGQSATLAPDFRRQLALMAARGDVIRLFHERLSQGAKSITPLQQGEVRGKVVRVGYHDRDLQTSPFAIVADDQGHEHYSRLSAQASLPSLGGRAILSKDARGNVRIIPECHYESRREIRNTNDLSDISSGGQIQPKRTQAQYVDQPTASLKEQLAHYIKSELGIHKHFIGVKTIQTEGVYRGTLDTPYGKFAIIDRGASIAAMKVTQMPQLQIGASVCASTSSRGVAELTQQIGLSL